MEALIVFIIFGAIFAIAYLFYSTRNKERLALIEKGADASIFVRGKREHTAPIWKVLTLNLALLSMGIGLGVLIAMILESTLIIERYNNGPLYLGSIFLTAGIGLLVGFFITKNLDKK